MERITKWNKENKRFECDGEIASGLTVEASYMGFDSFGKYHSDSVAFGKLVDKLGACEDEKEITREFILENGLFERLIEFKMAKESSIPEILPCPFCGETPQLFKMPQWNRKKKEDKYGIRCVGKECHFHPCTPYDTKEKVIAIWNERWE